MADDEEEDVQLDCSLSYVISCKCLPLVQGCLANSFWSGFPLYYVTMGWPLWRCGLAISLGFGLRWPVQLVTRRMGTWAYLPFCFLNLIFAIFAVVFVTEEWAVFCEVVALLAFDATLAVEATAYDWFSETSSGAMQASGSVLGIFALTMAASYAIGGVIYEFSSWQGISIYHVSCQGVIFLLLLVLPPTRQSFARFRRPETVVETSVVPTARATHFTSATTSSRGSKTPTSARPSGAEKWDVQSVDEAAPPGTVKEATPVKEAPPESASESNPDVGTSQTKKQTRLSTNTDKSGKSFKSAIQRPSIRPSVWSQRDRNTKGFSKMSSRMSRSIHVSRMTLMLGQERQNGKSVWSRGGEEVELESLELPFVVLRDLRPVFARRVNKGKDPFSASNIGKDVRWPIFLVLLCSFTLSFSTITECSLYTLLYVRFWSSAVWAGLIQTASELLAIVAMILRGVLMPEQDYDEDADAPSKLSKCVEVFLCEPYHLAVLICLVVCVNALLLIPVAAPIVIGQVLVGSFYTLGCNAASDMYLLYSGISGPENVYTFIVLSNVAEHIGGVIAGIVSMVLISESWEAPFLLSGGLALASFLLYIVGFCARVGTDILTAEADRMY